MRAVSTVLDASLCLLLVTASAVTLVETPTDRGGDPDAADDLAETIATSTATIEYRTAEGKPRTTHDTLAGLLAAAAIEDADGTAGGFVRTATARVERTLTRTNRGSQVIARTRSTTGREPHNRPERAAGRIVVGRSPPPDADVHAAAFAVRGVRVTVRTWSA